MAWQPGQPLRTTQDRLDWTEWKRARVAEAQRRRRSLYRRIDYIDVSAEAAEVIDRECATRASEGHYLEASYSAVLNRIVTEWEAYRSRVGKSRAPE